jgi:hypothetical protein
MAIGTGDAIHKFGTQDQVTVASPGSVANGAFSAAGDVNDWTNDDDAPMAIFVLVLQDLSGAATAGDTIDLYCKPLNVVNTTGDHQGPNANTLSIHLGSFLIDAVDPAATDHNYVLGPVGLPNTKTSQEYEFYIYNNLTTVSIDAADWELWITPVSYGEHA